MCWTTEREASEAAVAVAAAAGRSSDSDSFRDRPIHNDDNNDSPVARPVARRYRNAVRSFVFLFVLFVHCDHSLCSNSNNHYGIFRLGIFSIERKDSINWLCGSIVGSRDNKKHHHQPQPHRIGSVLCCFRA